MTIQPEGEALRRATRWILEEHAENPVENWGPLIAQACFKFDLSPQEAEFLSRWIRQRNAPARTAPEKPDCNEKPSP